MSVVLVTGGTGTLGRCVVEELVARSRTVRVLSRRHPAVAQTAVQWSVGDLRTGAGVADAVADTDVVVHCATGRGDRTSTRRLVAAAARSGQPHLVYISIVGVDRIGLGYYRSKLACEETVASCGLPWTVLRATQFHDLVLAACRVLTRLPVALVPACTSFQPVHAPEVAARLVDLACSTPAGRVPDMGGPEVRGADDLARAVLAATARHRLVVPVRLPGAVAAGYRAGHHLAPGHAQGRTTFEAFLAQRRGPRSPTR